MNFDSKFEKCKGVSPCMVNFDSKFEKCKGVSSPCILLNFATQNLKNVKGLVHAFWSILTQNLKNVRGKPMHFGEF